jgi:hypothetical protein
MKVKSLSFHLSLEMLRRDRELRRSAAFARQGLTKFDKSLEQFDEQNAAYHAALKRHYWRAAWCPWEDRPLPPVRPPSDVPAPTPDLVGFPPIPESSESP